VLAVLFNYLEAHGLYLDAPPWQTHIFSLTRVSG
jgi:hypothetical protein